LASRGVFVGTLLLDMAIDGSSNAGKMSMKLTARVKLVARGRHSLESAR
jgi:hypothetical protein